MAKRKTADIDSIIDCANRILRGDWPANTKEFRTGVIVMLDSILMNSGRGAGFRYLSNHELPGHIDPGVRYSADGSVLSYEERFLNTDDTRRQY